MMEKEIEYKGYVIKQMYDMDPVNPLKNSKFKLLSFEDPRLSWNSIDNYYNNIKLNIIEYFNSNEDFAFDHLTDLDYDGLDEDENTVDIIFDELQKLYYIDCVSIYEHSGIKVSRGIQNDWDSWIEGIIYILWNNKSEEELEYKADLLLTEYTSYLNGECYTIYIYDKHEKVIDSFSYIGLSFEDETINVAKQYIDNVLI